MTFPEPLWKRLRERIPAHRRSAFIVEAVEEKLALEEQSAAIEEAAGSWAEEDHPELRTDEDVSRWLAELRESWKGARVDMAAAHGEEGQIPAG